MLKAWNMIREQQQREEREEKSGINLCMHSAPSSAAAQTETTEQQQQQQQRRKDGEKLSFSGSSPLATKILGTRLGKRTCKSRKGGRGMEGKGGDPHEGGKKVLLLATEEPREGNKSLGGEGGASFPLSHRRRSWRSYTNCIYTRATHDSIEWAGGRRVARVGPC